MNSHPLFSGAAWIGTKLAGGPQTPSPAPFLRKSFTLGQPVKSAMLTVTALGLYECEINGRRVGDEAFAPGWTDYRHRVQYQSYDVTGQLSQGENAIGAVLGDGWYCGHVGWRSRQYYGERPLFLARLEVTLEDGSKTSLVTDATWKTIAGPVLENDLLMGEVYDARREFGEWSRAGYDDAEWQPVSLASPDPLPELSPRLGPPVRRIGEIAPVSVDLKRGIYDLGQNFAGRARLKVRAKRGTVVKLRFAEILDKDGSMYTANLRAARASDSYICKGSDEETWEPRFTFHGFRFVEVTGLGEGETAEVTGIVLHSDTRPTGDFRCSSELLNQLQHNIQWGQKSNFLEVPTDCPQRDERLGWTGDAQMFCETAAFNMDVAGFFHKWLRDLRDSQTPEGGIPCVIPLIRVDPTADEDGGPAWADSVIICPWTVYLAYGDRTILEENYEAMALFLDFIATRRSAGRIRSHPDVDRWGGFGDWLAKDGADSIEGATPKDLIGTAYYAYDAAIMAKAAAVLGLDADAKRYAALRAEIVEAFRSRYVTPAGLVFPGTQTAYVLALHFDLLPPELRQAAAAELVRDIERRCCHLSTGFVGTPYLLQALEESGHIEVAFRLLEQETYPSWLFPVKNGATTIWERWDGWTPEKGFQDTGMNSFNHYAYGAVGAWMYRTVAGLGLDPQAPGYRHITFRPHPGGSLTWAEATLQTRHGKTAIRWDLEGAKLRIRFTVPEGCHGTLQPPTGFEGAVAHYEAGTHEVALNKCLTSPVASP